VQTLFVSAKSWVDKL